MTAVGQPPLPAAMMDLVCATTNTDKAAEIALLLEGVAVLLPRPAGVGDVVEDAPDLRGNALLKARAVSHFAHTAAVADDTGLEVDALGGAPGVFSARYAGPDASYADNVSKLLSELEGLPASERGASFRTVAAVCWPEGAELVAEGRVEGHIVTEPRGTGGFGYDMVFVPAIDGSRTFAEMSATEKNRISHRGRAFEALADALSRHRY